MIINGRQVKVRAAYDPETRKWGIRERRVEDGKVIDRGLWASPNGGWSTSLGFGTECYRFDTRAEAEAYVKGYNEARREARDFAS